MGFMKYAAKRGRLGSPEPGKFCVGAVLADGDTGKILSTGYYLEFPADKDGDKGTTHAEQCCFMKVAQQHGLPTARAEEHIKDVLPKNTILYTTMEPCRARSHGARPCCERIIALSGVLKTVFNGINSPASPTADRDKCRQKLEAGGIEFVTVVEAEKMCYEVAMGYS